MDDAPTLIMCPDCRRVLPFTLSLLATDGRKAYVIALAMCAHCFDEGDVRSIRKKYEITKGAFECAAITHKTPIVIIH